MAGPDYLLLGPEHFFGDFGLDLQPWTIHNVKELSKSTMLQTIFEMHTTPEASLLYDPGAVYFVS